MPSTITMPKLSPTMEVGTIVKWLIKEGAPIKAGDILFEVATDKATIEYSALDKGFLRKILVQEGQEAEVNQPVAVVTVSQNESIEGYQPEGIKTTESSMEKTKEAPKEVLKQTQEKPQTVSKQQTGLSQPSFKPSAPLENYAFEWPTEDLEGRIKASPLAKKLAKEKGIDLTSIKGTGPNQRITSKDLDKGLADTLVSLGRRAQPGQSPGAYEEETLSPMRKVIGERLQASKTFIPHFYVTQEIIVDELVSMREQLKTFNIKLSFNDFLIRALALALKQHPDINSGFNSETQKIIRFKTIDISVAVSVEGGLITPIIRFADYKNVAEISAEVKVLVQKAKENKLKPEEFQGGSFTISNLGMFGIEHFTAVINPPQACILAVGGILEKPIVKDHQVTPAHVLTVTLSSDHRVVDGVAAAKFLTTLKNLLENPSILLLG